MTTENQEVTPNLETPPVETPPAAPLNLGGEPPAVKPEVKAEEKQEEKPAPKADEVVPVQYNPTGDAALDMVLKFVGDLGYGPENPAMAAAIEGDFTMLEAELAAKGVKGYDAYMKLGQKAYSETKAKTEARQKADREAVVNEVGGEENWTAIQKWASENAEPAEKTEFSAMLSKGGLQARAAAAYLKGAYDRANGAAESDGPGRQVSDAKGAAGGNGALSPREYAKEVAKARVGFKGDFETSPVYKQLQARRMAWRG